jgi:hypothetical protein
MQEGCAHREVETLAAEDLRALSEESRARELEQYLKSPSGHALAKKRLYSAGTFSEKDAVTAHRSAMPLPPAK